LPGELATNPVGAIVILHSDGQIARVADVKSAIWILKNVRPKHGAKVSVRTVIEGELHAIIDGMGWDLPMERCWD
jgi:hypothetical protein